MTIQYAPSAAAISWLALSQALDERALMEKALFSLFSDNTTLSVNQAKNQAINTQRSLEDQAKQQMWSGIMSMVGAGASVATTTLSTYMESSNLKKSSAPSVEDEVSFKEMKEEDDDISLDEFSNASGKNISNEKEDVQAQKDSPLDMPKAKAQIDGQNRPENSAEEGAKNSKSDKSQDNEAQANKAQQNRYMRNADWWLQNSNNFSSVSGQIFSNGISNLVQAPIIKDQGEARAVEGISQGLSAVFNGQSSMISSALSSCDSYMQNTNGTISTIIQVSSLRG